MAKVSRPRRSRSWLAAVLCIGLATAPAPLAAQSEADQDDVGQSDVGQSEVGQSEVGQSEVGQSEAETEIQQFEDWTLRCRPASAAQPRLCRMHQQVAAEDGGKPVLKFLVGRFGPEKVLGAVIYVPIGVRLPPGLGIQVDERPLHSYPFEICDKGTCQARAVLEGDLLKDLKAGLIGHVKFQNAAGQVLIVPVSLSGFSAALRALS